jgi:hypothetical protein
MQELQLGDALLRGDRWPPAYMQPVLAYCILQLSASVVPVRQAALSRLQRIQ